VSRRRAELAGPELADPACRDEGNHLSRQQRPAARRHHGDLSETVSARIEADVCADARVGEKAAHDHAGVEQADQRPAPGQHEKHDHPGKAHQEAGDGPSVREGLVGIAPARAACEGDAQRAGQVLARAPQRPHRQHDHRPGHLVEGGRELMRVPLVSPLRPSSVDDSEHHQSPFQHPEGPDRQGEVLRDQVGERDDPRRQHQLEVAQRGQRPHHVSVHDCDRQWHRGYRRHAQR
jgi:hypothetical protein